MTGQIQATHQEPHTREVVLQGLPICPGIGIGLVHLVDPDLAVQPTKLARRQVTAETECYTAAVKTTKRRLREHVATAHGDSPVPAASFRSECALFNLNKPITGGA